MVPMSHDLLGTTEAAERLGLSVRTIHRLVARGHLSPATKLPGSTGAYLFAAADVDTLAAALGRASRVGAA